MTRGAIINGLPPAMTIHSAIGRLKTSSFQVVFVDDLLFLVAPARKPPPPLRVQVLRQDKATYPGLCTLVPILNKLPVV